MTREQQVLLMLKPKVKAFGFNQKELKGIAAEIANNLTSAEDASDEDVNAEIETRIEAAIPLLRFAQSQSNRVIEEWRKNHPGALEEEDEEDEPSKKTKSKTPKQTTQPNDDQMKQLMDMIATLTGEISSLKKEKTTDSRKTRLEKLLKDAGTFGSRTLKNFSKMNFESDEEFEDFYAEIEGDLKEYNQERANNGLDKLGKVPQTGGGTDKIEVLTDEEIKALANL